jgi:hypothetical protein
MVEIVKSELNTMDTKYSPDALVGEHQSSSFESPLASHGVFADAGGKTDGTGALTRGVDGTVGGLFNVLEQLRLGSTGISKHENVDVATNAVLVERVLGNTAKQSESNGSLDIFVTKDGGCDRFDNLEKSVI